MKMNEFCSALAFNFRSRSECSPRLVSTFSFPGEPEPKWVLFFVFCHGIGSGSEASKKREFWGSWELRKQNKMQSLPQVFRHINHSSFLKQTGIGSTYFLHHSLETMGRVSLFTEEGV